MSRRNSHLAGCLLMAALTGWLAATPADAAEVGFVEAFAFAPDRAQAVAKLVPGTEEYGYYQALHLLNTERFDQVPPVLAAMQSRYGRTPRVVEVETRLALLTFDKDPAKAFEYVRARLGVRFDHRKEVFGLPPDLPTALDPKVISRATLTADTFRGVYGGRYLDNVEDAGLDGLPRAVLANGFVPEYVQRLTRPDAPDLVALVAQDIGQLAQFDFGFRPVHARLTVAQLDDLAARLPRVRNHPNYVRFYLAKLAPGADADWRRDAAELRAYLARLQAFAGRLDPVHNSLKAHVSYHRLAFDRARGEYDLGRFLEYLKLPRRQGYMTPLLRDTPTPYPADLGTDFAGQTLLPPVGPDEELVRDYLRHFLTAAADTKAFAQFIDADYLARLFAEVKITQGLGDPDALGAVLPADVFRALRDRVDIDFAPTNKAEFAAADPVRLDLFVKNVPNLIVKVFEVNTRAAYRTTLREIDTDINLDGLAANSERVVPTGEPPLRRVAKAVEFPEVTRAGVYVIDFIGNGKSSRALVRKGQLRPLVRTTPAGQAVTVVDDANVVVTDAVAWVEGREFAADKQGTILIPFTTTPGRKPIVLTRGDLSSLGYFDHAAEAYRFAAGIHIDREQLVAGRLATVLIRPALFVGDRPVSVKRLDEVTLRLTSTDLAGVPTSVEVPAVPVFEDRETTHEFRVPPRLSSLTATVTAKVKPVAGGEPVAVSATHTVTANGVAKTANVDALLFAQAGPDYVVECRGRTGEPRADRAVAVEFKHRLFKQPVRVGLKTDAAGRVTLGALTDIDAVTATGPDGVRLTWPVPADRTTPPRLVHATAGEVVTLPYLGAGAAVTRDEVALFDVQGETLRTDQFDKVAVKDGLLELRGLAPGDYELHMKQAGEVVRIRVVAGVEAGGFVLGRVRQLEKVRLKPVQIESVTADAGAVTVQLRNTSPFTRVHLFATRYRPPASAFDALAAVRAPDPAGTILGLTPSVYLTGRAIGDEYRYVLDRRGQKKFAGRLLDKPALLLNPWAVRSTATAEQLAREGEAFGAKNAALPPAAAPAPSDSGVGPGGAGADATSGRAVDVAGYADLDFLADPAAVLTNLVPDAAGVVTVPRAAVGPHAMINVVAVDPLNTTSRHVSLPDVPVQPLDLRLRAALDPAKHFTQQQRQVVLAAGKPFAVADVAGSRFQFTDSLAKVYALFATATKDPALAEFAFVPTWPALPADRKRALYSQYACHELNVFLSRHDPAFFAAVVKPHLANKRDKTFLDHFLLDADLSAYRQPWAFGRLNAAERVFLARRTPGEPAKTARHLADLLKLVPRTAERDQQEAFGFALGLQIDGLAAGDEFAKRKAGMEFGRPRAQSERQLSGPADTPTMYGRSAAPGMAPGPQAGRGSRPYRDGKADAAKDAKELGDGRDKDALFFEFTTKMGEVRQLYRPVAPTMEYAENNYYKRLITDQVAALVPVNRFWADYAKHDGKTPFVSAYVTDAAGSFAQMMLALSVLDLPFSSPKADPVFADGGMTLTPAGPGVAFVEEVTPAADAKGAPPVLVTENFARADDRFRDEAGDRVDKFVTDEFLTHTVYTGLVVVTNPTAARQRLGVLVQVPAGAVAVGGGQATRGVPADLEAYRTATVEYQFYFPRPGPFAHYPATVGKAGAFVAAAKPTTFTVVEKATKADAASWDYVSQNGTLEEVLAYLARANAAGVNLDKIAFRLTDRPAYEAVVKLLADRHVYHPTTWSYSLLHADTATAAQYLAHADSLVNEVGGPLVSPLLTIDPVARHQYEHLEYKPLVNARTHGLGPVRQIVNDRFHEQYHRFLKTLTYRATLTADDRLAAVYYLLLQDRTEEAAAAFAQVNPDAVATRVQYDYCAAYLALADDDPAAAKVLVSKHAAYPVDRWRAAFAAMAAQLAEADAPAVAAADPARDPALELTLAGPVAKLTVANVERVRVNYYKMDVELLFSRNPFAAQAGSQFALVRPNATRAVEVPAGATKLDVPLPAELAGQNVLVEVSGGGVTRSAPYSAAALGVSVTENTGRLQATDAAGKPLSKVYVKVYARLADGRVKFHKDGYTDPRGRFDYATVTTPETTPVARFAVLVLADDRGAAVREAAPPAR